ncbi:MAG: methionyl-tRNA formyltransferase [Dehalococcoidales bacterium]|nr:methionyl-tRNA formyltransferase [Dehalococcoidales bacterium]
MRIVFMGSPAAAVPSLEALVSAGYEVVAVYAQPDKPAGRGRMVVEPPVKQAARKLGIPVLQPEEVRSEGVLERLRGFRPEVIVVCAYGQILPQELLDIPPRQCLNVHFSLLPRHRGAAPVMAAILSGDEFTGVTIQLVRMKLDSGPVLCRAAIPVFDADTTASLTEKLAEVGARLLLEALAGWVRGEIVPQPQDEAQASYFPQVKKEEGEIDWRLTAVELARRVRAFYPWPGCYTKFRGKILKVVEAVPVAGEAAKGEVVALGEGVAPVVGVGTGGGILGLVRVQLEGRKVVTAAEFIRGQRDFIGSTLPS